MASRLAAAVFAASMAASPAPAGEYTTFHYLQVAPEALQPCRGGMMLSLPVSWQTGDGTVVLMTVGQPRSAARHLLISALLSEHAAVVELVPATCGAAHDRIIAGALDALDAMTRTMGAGMAVAIGYGPGAQAMLDVVREPALGLLGANGPRFAAAIAMGDGAAQFTLGEPPAARERASSRLAMLCRALAAVAEGMGDTPDRAEAATESGSCIRTLVSETALRAVPVSAAANQ
ncbi:hypothetical protein [Sabulicella rubraurantiaca]|uniref:hypothetical protein n=1 Tax=Sabulicella rubraurantiaca TaxID=2811429 RepID=UPI001A96A8BD|nr:hypothetical protein [Sabulicella rubraurantiaca]